jgi:septum formation protein
MGLILASASPRRKQLLLEAGFEFDVRAPDVDETPLDGEAPEAMAERLARAKASTVASDDVVLAADTVVVIGERTLGKPSDEREARDMLSALAGNTHRVLTGYALRSGEALHSGVAESRVRIRSLEPSEVAAYVATGEPLDKAGAYAVQGEAGRFVESIEGSRSNVIGLPIEVVVPLLARFGVRPA